MVDPDHIDLDNPEASGIGSPPRTADMSPRAMLLTAYRESVRTNIPRERWSLPAVAGEMLSRTSVRGAVLDAEYLVRFLRAVAEDENVGAIAIAAEEAAGAAVATHVGSSDVATANCQVAPVAPSPAHHFFCRQEVTWRCVFGCPVGRF